MAIVSAVERNGLSGSEAKQRLAADGPNALPQTARRTALRIVADVLREPMLALLIGGGAVYLVLGDVAEAILLLIFACMSVVITVVQEARTERVLEALRDLTSPRALVVRDGARVRIAGSDVVRGDLLVLAEGDRVPADARLVDAQDLQTDESLLTGESAPVRKLPDAQMRDAPRRPGGDDLPFVYSGTLVVRGVGLAEVVATGPRSEIGRIGRSCCSARCAAAGSMRYWPALPSACRCCPKNSPWCSPFSWRWGRGAFRRSACLQGARAPSRRWDRPRSCAPTRPGR